MKTNVVATGKRSLLIIFYRNPKLGEVKTRLAASLGDTKALAIYLHLAAHTKTITENVTADKAVYYSEYVDTKDHWSNNIYQKHLQSGSTLGERMSNAFRESFTSGYESICIIGTDCFELASSQIEEAFTRLKSHDAVIGPAEDGGYYLLGMNKLHVELFENKVWSTSSVCEATVQDIISLGLKYYRLPTLSDVDEEKDLGDVLKNLF